MPKNPEKFREASPEGFDNAEAEENEQSEQHEEVEALEELPLLRDDRMNLVLTYYGEKPCTTIEIDYFAKKPLAETGEAEEKRAQLEEALLASGLEFSVIETEEIDENGFDYKEFKFLIGKDKNVIAELQKAIEEGDTETEGRLYGFPDTAVEAFVRGHREDRFGEVMLDEKKWWKELSEEEKEKLLEEGVLNFKNFKLSKEHYQEELETLRKWQGLIKEKAPGLYQELMQRKPELTMSEQELEEYEAGEADKKLADIREKIENAADRLGNPIEEGIKETVVMFNAFDIRTQQSCEGYIEDEKKSAPWIMVRPRIPENEEWHEDEELSKKVEAQSDAMRKQLIDLLNLFYKQRKVDFENMLSFRETPYGFQIQSNGAEIFERLDEEEAKEKLPAYKKELQDFTEFLKDKCPKYLFKRL